MDDHAYSKEPRPTIENLSKAVYTVNRHAKTAPNPKYLYLLKKTGITKACERRQREKNRASLFK